MEYFGHSTNNLNDFEFKYIPKTQFEKVVRQVENERRSKKKGMWGDFCTISSEADIIKNSYVMKAPIESNEIYEKLKSTGQLIPSTAAPMFGPARIFEKSKQPNRSHRVRKTPSIHIVEEVNVASIQQSRQIFDDRIQITANDDVNDEESSSIECSSDNDDNLYSEILDMCNKIENSNDGRTSRNDDDYVEEVESRCESNKSDNGKYNELICEKYGSSIDDKLDLLDDDCNSLCEEEMKTFQTSSLSSSGRLRTENIQRKQKADESRKNPLMANQKTSKSDGKTHSDGKSSVKKMAKRDGLTRRNVDANEKSNNVNDRASSRPKSYESSASLQSLTVLLKISGYIEKTCEYLDRIHDIADNPPELDDVADLNKRKKRANEFTNRFARNHLYQIGRSTDELRLIHDNPIDIVTKVNSLFHIIMQAVQTYLKNIEMFIYNKNPDKLLALVDFIINASKICFDRKVFDKSDIMVMKMLRKCAEMREFVNENEHSEAVFFEMTRQKRRNADSEKLTVANAYKDVKKTTLPSRLKKSRTMVSHGADSKSSCDYMEVQQTKSPYGAKPQKSARSRKLSKNFENRKAPKNISKNPYSLPLTKTNVQQIQNTERQQTPQQKFLRKASSDVSTVMQLETQKERENVKLPTVPEQPFENESNFSELMRMIENITKDKFEEIIAPILATLVPKNDSSKAEEIKCVNAAVEPLKKESDSQKNAESLETVERISRNVQYMYVKSLTDDDNDVPKAMEPPSTSRDAVAIIEKPPISACNIDIDDDEDDNDNDCKRMSIEEMREKAMKERLDILEKMSKNPLYVNDEIKEPWKVFSKISDGILDELLESVINELDIKDELIEQFLNCELAI